MEDSSLTLFDVVVIGSGIAGSGAAWTAARAGARVLLLEKSQEPGGSAAMSAGMFWTAPTLDTYRARIPLGDVRLAERMLDDYPVALDELRSSGVFVAPDPQHNIMTFGIGYSFDIRSYLAHLRAGVIASGGQILTGIGSLRIDRDDAQPSFRLTLGRADGTALKIEAAAVVLATGGFQGSPELVSEHVGENASRLVLRSNPGSTGDGLRLAEHLGAAQAGDMGTFYGHLLPSPMQTFESENYLPYSQYYSERTIIVNFHGERFIDETLGDELINQKLVLQTGARGVMIFDDHVRRVHATAEPFPGLGVLDRYEVGVAAGARHAEASTIDQLVERIATTFGIGADRLADTLDSYRQALRVGGSDTGITVSANARAPLTAPFYAIEVQPSVTFTFGGIAIDDQARAIGAQGDPVPGLFAAGADIGGLSNFGYAGGLAPAYITGRWAGRNAAALARRETARRR